MPVNDNAEDATSDDTEIDETQETTEDETTEGEQALGDAGKKALDAMKAQRNAAAKDAKAVRAELEQLRAAAALKDKPAEEQAIEQARAEARAEATKAANARIIKSELRLAAKGLLADPADALAFINLDDFDVNDDGDVDTDALTEAINELIEKKPHLAAGRNARFDGNADQGAKGKAAKPSQLTESDLESMSLEEINKARREGRANRLLGIN